MGGEGCEEVRVVLLSQSLQWWCSLDVELFARRGEIWSYLRIAQVDTPVCV